jgi:hypothetical protein
MISYHLPANLMQMKLFTFKKSKTLLKLWRVVESCFVKTEKSRKQSHQQRYGQILNEFNDLKNEEIICGTHIMKKSKKTGHLWAFFPIFWVIFLDISTHIFQIFSFFEFSWI